jgi:hypothetical protein
MQVKTRNINRRTDKKRSKAAKQETLARRAVRAAKQGVAVTR